MLGLDMPPQPLFKKEVMLKKKNRTINLPQVSLFEILKKFDGETITEVVSPSVARVRYRPQYLILHMCRFVKNNFVVDKISTLVNFPLKNLEMKDYIPLPTPTKATDSKYDLIANIVHDGRTREGPSSYRVFVQRKSEKFGMRCKIYTCPKFVPRWLNSLRLTSRYMSGSSYIPDIVVSFV